MKKGGFERIKSNWRLLTGSKGLSRQYLDVFDARSGVH